MNISKVIYWIAVTSLGVYVIKSAVLFQSDAAVGDSLAISLWLYLWWMLFRRPKNWALGIGIFMFLTLAVQVGLWQLAQHSPRKEELGVGASWLSFVMSSLLLFISGASSISLRWLLPKGPIQNEN